MHEQSDLPFLTLLLLRHAYTTQFAAPLRNPTLPSLTLIYYQVSRNHHRRNVRFCISLVRDTISLKSLYCLCCWVSKLIKENQKIN